jgi:hypothetical protein
MPRDTGDVLDVVRCARRAATWGAGASTLRLHDADSFSGHLEELRSMPSLKSLHLPSRYSERAVDATALCTLTGLFIEARR